MTPAEIHQALQAAVVCANEGRAVDAHRTLQQILAIDPNQIDAISQLALLCLREKNYESAIQYFERALAITQSPALCANFGLALASAGKLSAAFAAYRRAIELNPNIPEIHFNLGHALQQAGQLAEAMV